MSIDEREVIIKVAKSGVIDTHRSVRENYIAALSRKFTRRQLEMLRSLELNSLNPNPFLIRSLNLKSPKEVVTLNVYATATRSIVTSFGIVIQDILAATSDSVERVKAGWDLVKIMVDRRHFVQIKSGNNDMDKDQILYWKEKIENAEKEGSSGYIGFTYGKKEDQTVTMGLLKKYLPNWELKTLIGKDLWTFLSDDPEMHSKVLEILREEAQRVLDGEDLVEEVNNCIESITNEFIPRFGDGEEGVRKYIASLF